MSNTRKLAKCLAITGPFVPTNEPMTLLSYKYLRGMNVKCDVIALKHDEDQSLKAKTLLDAKYKNFNVSFVGKYNDALFSIKNVNLIKALYNVQKYVEKAFESYDESYDLIFTSSFPAYAHRAGKKIKDNYKGVKWIASFSDPINNSPYKNDIRTYNEYSLIEKIAFKAYCRYFVNDNDEIIALENADVLIFICEEQRDFMIEQYLKKNNNLTKEALLAKSVIFPLNYIKEWNDVVKMDIMSNNETHIFAHFGRIYGLRDATKFIYAINDLVKNKQINKQFIVKQFGEFRKSDIQLIENLGLKNYFIINDKISYDDCIKEMNMADTLLIFDTIMPEDEIQPYLPSKVLEYSLLKKNIMTITCKKSPCYRICNDSKAIVALNEISSIKQAILRSLTNEKSTLDYCYTNEEAATELHNMLIKMGIM